jgi:hypothetical protein
MVAIATNKYITCKCILAMVAMAESNKHKYGWKNNKNRSNVDGDWQKVCITKDKPDLIIYNIS